MPEGRVRMPAEHQDTPGGGDRDLPAPAQRRRRVSRDAWGGRSCVRWACEIKDGGGGVRHSPLRTHPKLHPGVSGGWRTSPTLDQSVQRRMPLFLLACSGCDYGNLASRHVVLSDSRSGSCSGQGKGRRFPNIDDNVTI